MPKRKESPETQIIQLFTGLSDEGKRMVMFGLNAIMGVTSPKSPAPAVAPRSSRKAGSKTGSESPTASSETVRDDAGNAAPESPKSESGRKGKAALCIAIVPGLDVECGNPEDNGIHDPNGGYGGYHEFEAGKAKKAAAQK